MTRIGKSCKGDIEAAPTGVLRMEEMATKGEVPILVISVNDYATKSKLDNPE